MKKIQKSEFRNQDKLNTEEVKHVADLAGFKLSEEETKNYQRWLSETLDYIQILNQTKTENFEPTAQVTGLENVFREDKFGKGGLSQEESLSTTPSKARGYFKIKKIL